MGKCSRLPVQHKKMTFDQVSVFAQWEYREWKCHKMSDFVGWLIDSQEFNQVVRSSRVEAIGTERKEFVLYP